MNTESRECVICQQQRLAAATLKLPCCLQQVMCVWCVAHAAEIQHSINCNYCGESISSPFSMPVPGIYRSGNTSNRNSLILSGSRSPIIKSAFGLDKLAAASLSELQEDRVVTCSHKQCPYETTEMACFHCGTWMCEMHELAHTNELSDRLLLEIETLSKRINKWESKSNRVVSKMKRVTEEFEKNFRQVVDSWAENARLAFVAEIDRKVDILLAEARQLKYDIDFAVKDTEMRSKVAGSLVVKSDDLLTSLLVRGHSLADIEMCTREVRKLRIKTAELEHLIVPAPKFLPGLAAKPAAAWIKDERNIFEWVTFFDGEEQAILEKIGNNKTAAVMGSASAGNLEATLLIIDHIEDEEEKFNLINNALIAASAAGKTHVTEILLTKYGANINARDHSGSSPIIHAAASGNCETVNLLLDRGAIIADNNNVGYDSLMVASEKGFTAVVECLIDRGAVVDSTTKFGDTALLFASYWGNFEVAKLLLDNSANIDVQNNNGDSPLIAAASNGHTAVVKFLIDRGANLKAVNSKGCNALEAASKSELKILLYSKGARSNKEVVPRIRRGSLLTNTTLWRKFLSH